LPIVETIDGFKSVNEVYFFDEELLSNNECFDDIYTLVSTFYSNIPTKDKVFYGVNSQASGQTKKQMKRLNLLGTKI
jgi:hypothetical protein